LKITTISIHFIHFEALGRFMEHSIRDRGKRHSDSVYIYLYIYKDKVNQAEPRHKLLGFEALKICLTGSAPNRFDGAKARAIPGILAKWMGHFELTRSSRAKLLR